MSKILTYRSNVAKIQEFNPSSFSLPPHQASQKPSPSFLHPTPHLPNLLLQLLQQPRNTPLQAPRPRLQLPLRRRRRLLTMPMPMRRLLFRRSINLLMNTIIRHQRLRITRSLILILRESSWWRSRIGRGHELSIWLLRGCETGRVD